MKIKAIRKDLEKLIKEQGMEKKWKKAKGLFEKNLRHPSLHVELLKPRWRGIYSFRLDKKYRSLFFITDGKAEVFQITKHYQK